MGRIEGRSPEDHVLCERCQRAEAVASLCHISLGGQKTVQVCAACAGHGRPPDPAGTGVERFGALHAHALRLLARLEAAYDVTRSDALPPLTGLRGLRGAEGPPARPPVLLTPRLPEAAPLGVAFTALPGLVVRCGRWYEAAVPVGGGDLPGETLEAATARLEDLVGKVVDGLFAEAVRVPPFGRARLAATFGDGTPRAGLYGEGWTSIPRDRARALIGSGPRAVRWRPWPRRRLSFSADGAVA